MCIHSYVRTYVLDVYMYKHVQLKKKGISHVHITTFEKQRAFFQLPFIHEGSKYLLFVLRKLHIAKAMKLGALTVFIGRPNWSRTAKRIRIW